MKKGKAKDSKYIKALTRMELRRSKTTANETRSK
jgi:hypothetical protein